MKSTSMSHVMTKNMALIEDTLTNNHGGLKEVAKKNNMMFFGMINYVHKMTAVFFMCWLSLGVSFFSPKRIKDFTCSWLISGIRDGEDFRLNAYEITIFCWGGWWIRPLVTELDALSRLAHLDLFVRLHWQSPSPPTSGDVRWSTAQKKVVSHSPGQKH